MNQSRFVKSDINIYYQYLEDISKYPLLKPSEEKILIDRIQKGDRAALNLLVKSNLRFVINIANLYKGQGLELEDLISEGNLGLIEAAHRFDSHQKIKFISYAVWWIRQNITKAIFERGRLVRISAEKELVLRRFSKKGGNLKQVVGGSYVLDTQSLEGISKYKGDSIEKVLMMNHKSSSLESPVGEDGESTLGDVIPSKELNAESKALSKDKKKIYEKVLDSNLTEQESEIMKLYYGFKMDTNLNLKDVSSMVKLSKERVRQIKEEALTKLRNNQIQKALEEAA